jgi:hypothetical protein
LLAGFGFAADHLAIPVARIIEQGNQECMRKAVSWFHGFLIESKDGVENLPAKLDCPKRISQYPFRPIYIGHDETISTFNFGRPGFRRFDFIA